LGEPRGAALGGHIVFVGAVHEAAPALRALLDAGAPPTGVVTLDETLASRTAGAVDLAAIVAGRGIPVLRTANLNAPAEVARVRALRPVLIVVVGWTRLLSGELLAMPRLGCVGFHASLLPRHRGRAPVNWAILRGETTTGNTMMYLAPGADEGDIIDQRAVTIEPDDTCGTVYEKVAAAGAAMLREHLPALLSGTAPRRRQGDPEEKPLPKRTPEMGVTDWNRPARAVHDWIRALTHPYPGAFGFLDPLAGGAPERALPVRKVFLWSSEVPRDHEPEGAPGAIMGVEGDAVRIGARGGSLRIVRIQEEGLPEESGALWYSRWKEAARSGSAVAGSGAADAGPCVADAESGASTAESYAAGAPDRVGGALRFEPVDEQTSRWTLGLGPKPGDSGRERIAAPSPLLAPGEATGQAGTTVHEDSRFVKKGGHRERGRRRSASR
jgi:methionyl-tRNA formyltransferase